MRKKRSYFQCIVYSLMMTEGDVIIIGDRLDPIPGLFHFLNDLSDVLCFDRASCVMLNKGKHVVEAVSTLDKILHINTAQMQADLKPLPLSSHLF